MKVINRKTQESPVSFGYKVYEYTLELDSGKIIYLDMYKDDHDNKVSFEDAEHWAYLVPFKRVTDEPGRDEYYKCSEEELRQIYNFCLEN